MSINGCARFAGARVLVTGGAQGIGRAIAERFAGEGATVVIADLDPAAAERTAGEISASTGSRVVAAALDVRDRASFDELSRTTGELDVVVANAGVQTFTPALELQTAEWDRVLEINARGAMLTLQFAAAHLVDGGAAVTVSSVQAGIANPLSVPYAASKAAVSSVTRSFAAALAPRGIRVNAVAPGRIATPLADLANRELGRIAGLDPEEMLQARISTNPLGRTGEPAEVAGVVAFLASADASYLTGTSIDVCGGDVMR